MGHYNTFSTIVQPTCQPPKSRSNFNFRTTKAYGGSACTKSFWVSAKHLHIIGEEAQFSTINDNTPIYILLGTQKTLFPRSLT